MKDLYVFNGPPQSGKSTSRRITYGIVDNALDVAFSDCLYDGVGGLYGVTKTRINEIADGHKDEPMSEFFGKTLRECLIGMSEGFLKPFHDDRHVFSRILANKFNRMPRSNTMNGIIDSGFFDELTGFIDCLENKPTKILIVNISKEGRSFDGDSRHYITQNNFTKYPAVFLHIENNGSKPDLHLKIIEAIAKFNQHEILE